MNDVTHYQGRIQQLEDELGEMTIALSQAWDQLVPFLQEVPSQAENAHDIEPILHAVAAAADTTIAGIFLFQSNEWFSVPETLTLTDESVQKLRSVTKEMMLDCHQPDSTIHWAFAPVVSEKAIIGVLGIGTRDQRRAFTAVDLRIVQRMADRFGTQVAASQLARIREREAVMVRDLQISHDIQRSIQPVKPPSTERIKLAAYWNPAKEVGGDAWGWVQQHSRGLAWFILDVAGKGLPAALAAVSLHTAISMALRMRVSPTDALRIINEHFYDPYTRTDLMATVAIIALNPETGVLELANAGHPPILVRHQGTWLRMAATVPPIGVLPSMQTEPQVLMLQPNDLIIAYSDGLTEIQAQTGLWGQTGILGTIPKGAHDVEALTRHIVATAQRVGEIQDDQTLVTAIYTAGE